MMSHIEVVKDHALQLEKTISNLKEVEDVYLQLGNSAEAAKYGVVSSPTEAKYSVLVRDQENIDTVLEKIENQQEKYEGAKLYVVAGSFMMGARGTTITIDVIGNNPKRA